MHNGIKYMPRLSIIVLVHSELPSRIVMRVRHHEHLQLLRVPLVSPVRHTPPLLPRAAVDVQKLNLVVQRLGGDVHGGAGEGAEIGSGRKGLSYDGFAGA